MRDKSIKKLFTTFLVLLFLSSIFYFPTTDTRKNEIFQTNIKEDTLKTSNFWDLTGSPIFIDDNDPSKNWSYTASHYDWCSGSGSWIDPYIIENVTIDGQGSSKCIVIRNSDAYFIVRNCSLYNSGSSGDDAGIKLYFVDNGKIINNDCSDNYYNGIHLSNSNNNTLSGNTVNNNGYNGICLWDCDNNVLSENTVNINSIGINLDGYNNALSGNLMNFCGISFKGSLTEAASHIIDDTNLVNNKPVYYYVNELGLGSSNFTNAGQIILVNCSNSIISGLNLSNGTTGIYLRYSNNNMISGNTANNNNQHGIYIEEGNNNTISENTANNNNQHGIYIEEGNNNTILDNKAFNNTRSGIRLLGMYNNASRNTMENCGISAWGPLEWRITCFIDTSNTVNDKPVYFFNNEIGLKSYNFSNAGQVQLNNCSNSVILNLNISNTTTGIYLFLCNNNTVSGNIVNNNKNIGILFRGDNNTISGNNVSNNKNIGILFWGDNNTISKNIMNNNTANGMIFYGENNSISENTLNYNQESGIYASGVNNFISENTLNYNQESGIYAGGDNNFFVENEANNNNQDGIKIEGHNNTIVDNRAFNNNNYGIYTMGMHNNASRNTMKNCGIVAAGPLEWRITCFVDDSNIVNEKPVYFYNNEIGLNSYNFTNAGQVQLNNCSNSLISNLNISNTTIGISIFFGNNNTISENIANNNHYFGIIFNGDNNTISGNILNNNKDSGIYLDGNNNKLIGNTMCSNNRYGVYPMMSTCDFNLFVENNISKNGEMGVLLTPGSNDNLFYRNIFDGNGLNAEDSGVNNIWDNGIIGNYWSDYSGTDLNNDGIGDSPYNIFGTANSQDNFPILDISPPKIIINYPNSYDIFGSNAPDFSVEIIEPHIDKMWYTINNGTNIFFTLNGTINQALWNTLLEGNVSIRFYANDTLGWIGFQEVIIVKKHSQSSLPEIPGYDLLFLLGIISTLSIIIIRKRLNHLD